MSEAKKKPGNPAVVWTIRIVVFGVLIALLVVAYLQFSAKRAFEKSQTAINAKWEDNKQLTLKEAEELMEGSYEKSEGEKQGGTNTNVYTWSGPFSSHKLSIRYAPKSGAIMEKPWSKAADDEAE